MPAHVNSSNAEWCLFTGLPLWRKTDTVGDSKADNPKKLLKKWPDGVFASPVGQQPSDDTYYPPSPTGLYLGQTPCPTES